VIVSAVSSAVSVQARTRLCAVTLVEVRVVQSQAEIEWIGIHEHTQTRGGIGRCERHVIELEPFIDLRHVQQILIRKVGHHVTLNRAFLNLKYSANADHAVTAVLGNQSLAHTRDRIVRAGAHVTADTNDRPWQTLRPVHIA